MSNSTTAPQGFSPPPRRGSCPRSETEERDRGCRGGDEAPQGFSSPCRGGDEAQGAQGAQWAFIFDMDGVLVDSTGHWQKVVEPFLTLHIPGWNSNKALEVAGVTMPDMYRILVDWGFSLSEAEFFRFVEVSAAEVYRRRATLVPGLRELLDVILSSGYKTAVASSSPAHWVQMVLTRFELRPCFAEVVTSDDVRRGKPDPDIFLLAATRLHTAPARCVVIEDSLVGIHAAKSAGMRCIAIDTTLPASVLKEADFVVSTMGEIQSLLATQSL